jgi:hypothetical protein
MDTQKMAVLTVLSVGSLLWGMKDLRKKKRDGVPYDAMSIIQVAGGIAGILFIAYLNLI